MAVYPVSAGQVDYSGTFLPEVWSAKINQKFYDTTVIGAIANTDWEGEIKDKGEKVIIRQRPSITIRDYQKGADLTYEQPEAPNVELLIDQGHYWAVEMDDVDAVQADLDWLNEFSEDASEQLKIKVDNNVLGSIYADVDAANTGTTAGRLSGDINLGATGSPVALTSANIIDKIVDLGTVLDEQNVPETGRWLVLPPGICGLIKKSDLKDASLSGDGTSILRNGRVGMVDRFTIYKSNLLSKVTDGGNSPYHIVAGHKAGLTFAAQVTKTQRIPTPESSFKQLLRGLMVYGFKVNYGVALAHLYGYKA